MVNYLIPEQLLDSVIRYLEARPYKEVAPAVAALRELPQHVDSIPPAWELLAQCIRSGQVSEDRVFKIMDEDKPFAEWFNQNPGVV
jgi:hypothetical protein